jgi:S-adenosylhomocysteine hydrolase
MSEEGVMEVEVQEAEMGVLDALKEVFKKAALFDGLRRGIHE